MEQDQQSNPYGEALAEAAKLLELAQAQLQRARARAPKDFTDRTDILAKRAFELKVKADWLRCLDQGKISFSDRQSSDRRFSIDRRLVRMQKVLLSLA
jgi:hypothetical protein